MHSPFVSHEQSVKGVLGYVKGTVNFGIRILSQSSLNLDGFSNADWARCPNTRRLTFGYCMFSGSNCISWHAKEQCSLIQH